MRGTATAKLAFKDMPVVPFRALGVDVLAQYLKGDKVEPRVFIKHVIIDKTNIETFDRNSSLAPDGFKPEFSVD